MKSKIILFKLCLTAAIALSGCAINNSTFSNYDKSVNFTKYKTYAWLNSHKSTPHYNDVIDYFGRTVPVIPDEPYQCI